MKYILTSYLTILLGICFVSAAYSSEKTNPSQTNSIIRASAGDEQVNYDNEPPSTPPPPPEKPNIHSVSLNQPPTSLPKPETPGALNTLACKISLERNALCYFQSVFFLGHPGVLFLIRKKMAKRKIPKNKLILLKFLHLSTAKNCNLNSILREN